MSNNISLIGMPGSGKSTLGKLLAKELSKSFLDTDELIEAQHQQSLQNIMNHHGKKGFQKIENQTLLSINPSNTIISTGGSAIFCQEGLIHLKQISTLIFLNVPLEQLEQRIQNFHTRGLFKSPKQSLKEIYQERQPLYQTQTHLSLNITNQAPKETLPQLIQLLNQIKE